MNGLNTPLNFEKLVEESGDALVVIDATWHYVYFNSEAERLLGRPRAEVIGKNLWDVFPLELATPLHDRMQHTMREHVPTQFDYHFVSANVWLEIRLFSADNAGVPGGVAVYARDITARRRSEALLAENLNLLSAIAYGTGDAVFVKDREGRYLFANEAVARTVGKPVLKIVGFFDGDIMPDDAARAVLANDLAVMEAGQPLVTEETVPDADGMPHYFMAAKSPYRDAISGAIIGIIATSQDITDRKLGETDRAAALSRQRRFMREVVFSLTEGKFRLCLSEADLPAPLAPASDPAELTVPALRPFRKQLNAITALMGFAVQRAQDIETAVGEATMNAATHGGGGAGTIRADTERGVIQIWIRDGGGGISEEALPRVLEKGVSSAGTLGHGFSLMLQTCDRIYLLTGPGGTTVVLEMDCAAPEPAWLKSFV